MSARPESDFDEDPRGYVGPASLDPFATLSIDSRRLTLLMHLRSSVRTGEPVFNVNGAIHYQGLQSVFDEELTYGPLTAVLDLTMSFAASQWCFKNECSHFNTIAVGQLREGLSNSDAVCMPAIIGTILLLLSTEVCRCCLSGT